MEEHDVLIVMDDCKLEVCIDEHTIYSLCDGYKGFITIEQGSVKYVVNKKKINFIQYI